VILLSRPPWEGIISICFSDIGTALFNTATSASRHAMVEGKEEDHDIAAGCKSIDAVTLRFNKHFAYSSTSPSIGIPLDTSFRRR
jgi:hypothetical protein